MKFIITAILFCLSSLSFANYQISSDTVDGVTMTKNREPAKGCSSLGSFEFKAKYMARDEKGIIEHTKAMGGNFVVEHYDNYPSMNHKGDVYKCP